MYLEGYRRHREARADSILIHPEQDCRAMQSMMLRMAVGL